MNRTRLVGAAGTTGLALLLIVATQFGQPQLMAQEPAVPLAGTPFYIPLVLNEIDLSSELPGIDPPEGEATETPPNTTVVTDPIFANGFEAGSFAGWTKAVTDGGDLSVSPEAQLVDSQGMRVLLDDGVLIYVTDETPRAEKRVRVRVHVDPNSIPMAENDDIVFFTGNSQGNARLVQMELRRASGQYWLRAGLINDVNKFTYTPYVAISDAPHAAEIDWVASTNGRTRNGALTFWVDGAQQGQITGIDNNWRPVERVRLGALMAVDPGTRGVFYLDAYEARRVTYIGPAQQGSQPTATPTTVSGPTSTPTPTPTLVSGPTPTPIAGMPPVVFVSRNIPREGTIYWSVPNSMPGVGPYGRFQVSAPGKLIIRESSGAMRVLIDGSQPSAASLNLIDVNAPDVSYDGSRIVFAGLPNGSYSLRPLNDPGAWRIYMINVDGTGLRQVTFSDRDNLNLSQFGQVASHFVDYDDTDPAWLPDGRLVFSSTRWPSHGMYSAALTSNLYVVNADGSGMHRITAERNGADRPMVDPLTGKIVYSRWWRNLRTATNSMQTVTDPNGGYQMRDGLLSLNHVGIAGDEVGGKGNLNRNAWHLATVNPDGTGLLQWGGESNTSNVGQVRNMAYGGTFAPDGSFYANFFPMMNGTEAAGFGGIRHFGRSASGSTPIIGITDQSGQFASQSPVSYGVYVGSYAGEPEYLANGKILISWAKDVLQDYGLYTMNPDGTGLAVLYDNPGTTELRARAVMPRQVPPVIPDQVTSVASLLPPLAQGPYDIDGRYTFDALNVYFNAPVDSNIVSAMPVGSAGTIRVFADFQRSQQDGSHETKDWPILVQEVPVNADGSVQLQSPANIPVFEQMRSAQPSYQVPLTGRGTTPNDLGGAAHVAGLNFGRPGEVQRCVGCHAGHSMIPVPANPEDAKWTNLAPGATVSTSSLSSELASSWVRSGGLVDRRVRLPALLWGSSSTKYWISASGQSPTSQWAQLVFPVPVTVRTVRPYDVPGNSINVLNATVRLYSDAAGTVQVASSQTGALSDTGTDVAFNDVQARVVRIEITSVSGSVAGLAEVEVIARAGPRP